MTRNSTIQAYTPLDDAIGARIEQARQALGYVRQSDAAAAMGTSLRNYSRLVRGHGALELRHLRWLVDSGISLDWIVTGDGPMRRGERLTPSLPTTGAMPDTHLLEMVLGLLHEDLEARGADGVRPAQIAKAVALLYRIAAITSSGSEREGLATALRPEVRLLLDLILP